MISTVNQVIQKLSGNKVLVAREQKPGEFNSEEQKIISRLKERDREVRVHEMSHGANPEIIKIGSAQLDYTIGPDGKAYAVGGQQTVSTGSARNPEGALLKAEALKKAAVAPGESSPLDLQALNAAKAMEIEAANQIYLSNKNIKKSNHSLLKGTNLNILA
jgi:hypothetical protein